MVKKKNKYKFSTIKEQLIDTGVPLVSIGVLAFGIGQIFTPLFASSLCLLAAGMTGYIKSNSDRQDRKRPIVEAIYQKEIGLLKKVSIKLGLKNTPSFSISSKSKHKHYFGAIIGANHIEASSASIEHHRQDKEKLKFIFAHEASHLKTDDNSPSALLGLTKGIITSGAITLTSFAGIIAYAIGLSNPVLAPVITAKAVGIFAASYISSSIGLNFASRTIEKRADRNALYATGNLDAAIGVMDDLYSNREKKVSLLNESFRTHPSYNRRVASLKRPFNKMAKAGHITPKQPNLKSKSEKLEI